MWEYDILRHSDTENLTQISFQDFKKVNYFTIQATWNMFVNININKIIYYFYCLTKTYN